jgi:hypothetical protein
MPEEQLQQRVQRYISEYAGQGNHRSGSDADLTNATWMAGIISDLGLEPTQEEYAFSRLVIDRCEARVDGVLVEGIPLFDGGSTSADGLGGSLGLLGSDADIGLVMVSPNSGHQTVKELNNARRTGAHSAIIAVTDLSLPGSGIALLNAEDFMQPYGCPVIQVANSHWQLLNESAAGNKVIHLFVNTHRVESKLVNVGARVYGSDDQADPLVVMTPRSGWWQCASERGGGIACFFEIMRTAISARLDRDVIFTANSGHELDHLGLDMFLEGQPSLVRRAKTWIHLGANFAAAGQDAGVLLQYSDESLKLLIHRIMDEQGVKPDMEMPLASRALGEARNIFDGGGRFASVLGSNPLFHHPADTWPDSVDLNKTCQWIEVFTQLVIQLGKESA